MSDSASRSDSVRAEVRRQGRARRNALTGPDRLRATRRLHDHLASLHDLADAARVGVFVADDGEPDIGPVVEWFWSAGAQVALPVLGDKRSDRSMAFATWSCGDVLVPGRFGIPTPPSVESVEPSVVLVPFTGFDAAGNRIGRGGGFFDRFLAGSTARPIGVGFECQRFDTIPTEPHDVALPIIVTDLGVRYCVDKVGQKARQW